MSAKKPANIFFLFGIILIVLAVSAFAVPELPMIISGNAVINEKPAVSGTRISIHADGKEISSTSVTDGKFSALAQQVKEGTKLEIYVDGIKSSESVEYKSGDYKEINVSARKTELWVYLLIVSGGIVVIILVLLLWKFKSGKRKN